MDRMVAYCGIVCSDCPGYIATQNDDDEQRRKVAEEWSEMFSADIKPEHINCDGCLATTGKLIEYCSSCEIRKCAQEKDVANCAHCAEYSCDRLDKWFKDVPSAKKVLDEIAQSLQQ